MTNININYGKHGFITNIIYNGICDKIQQFAEETGADPYNRVFDAEPLIDFAIEFDLTSLSIDEIYKRYVYYKLDRFDPILTTETLNICEMEDNLQTFVLIN